MPCESMKDLKEDEDPTESENPDTTDATELLHLHSYSVEQLVASCENFVVKNIFVLVQEMIDKSNQRCYNFSVKTF